MKIPARNSNASSERAGVIRTGSARAPSVLVVDDERLVADTLSLIFQRAGFETHAAYSAAEALQVASVHAPDMLVSDVDMPITTGVELALTLLQRNPKCDVILFSGHASVADLARAEAAGYAFPLLPKPVHPQVLLESVSERLGVEIPAELRVAVPAARLEAMRWSA